MVRCRRPPVAMAPGHGPWLAPGSYPHPQLQIYCERPPISEVANRLRCGIGGRLELGVRRGRAVADLTIAPRHLPKKMRLANPGGEFAWRYAKKNSMFEIRERENWRCRLTSLLSLTLVPGARADGRRCRLPGAADLRLSSGQRIQKPMVLDEQNSRFGARPTQLPKHRIGARVVVVQPPFFGLPILPCPRAFIIQPRQRLFVSPPAIRAFWRMAISVLGLAPFRTLLIAKPSLASFRASFITATSPCFQRVLSLSSTSTRSGPGWAMSQLSSADPWGDIPRF